MVPIKIKIGLKANGNAAYPDFNQLQIVKDSGLDWSVYVDVMGLEWHYDRTSGHKDNSVDSPYGQQWGTLIVPEAFADQAIEMFPTLITYLNETELEDFYDNKSHVYEPDQIITKPILDNIKAKQDLEIDLTQSDLNALNPDNPSPGIVKNNNKKWIDFKTLKDVTIKDKTI